MIKKLPGSTIVDPGNLSIRPYYIYYINNYSALALEPALSDGYLFRDYSLNLLQISIRQGFGDIFFNGLNNYLYYFL